MAPAGTPPGIIDKLNKAVNEALKDPTLLRNFTTQGLDPLGGTPQDFAKFIAGETERWARVIHSMDQAKPPK
jgi:tripartite-type tricarboxylate transporter receptor subunit TctC